MSLNSDVLIVGSGSAGLICALSLAESGLSVTVATKDAVTESSSAYAQGGIAVSLLAEDSVEAHIQDTLKVGQGHCNEAIVRSFIAEIAPGISQLARWGMPFTGYKDGQVTDISALGLEAAHTHRRILKVGSDLTGRLMMKTLWGLACRHPRISISQGTVLIDLILDQEHPICRGGYFQDINHNLFALEAQATVLATGGYSSLFSHSTNPGLMVGDGLAAALRADCAVSDLEFQQFHPTVLNHKSHFLLSEALRGEGAILLNSDGERFMERYAPSDKELAPRSVVSQAVWEEGQNQKQVYLDLSFRGEAFLKSRFEGIYSTCKTLGFDLAAGPLPIITAAHYSIGGVSTDQNGQTSCPGLWGIGEVSCTGLHGADRLASNSLLECIVSAFKAARAIESYLSSGADLAMKRPIKDLTLNHDPAWSELEIGDFKQKIRDLMWDLASFQRDTNKAILLKQSLAKIRASLQLNRRPFANPLLNELDNMLLAGTQMAEAISLRPYSLGVHQWKGIDTGGFPARYC